ncbi:MAG: hypothetical protein ACI9HI_000679, partial [Salinirussus sp.]
APVPVAAPGHHSSTRSKRLLKTAYGRHPAGDDE